jgi:hypothetical protein
MVYNAQNYWISGLYPSPGVLNTTVLSSIEFRTKSRPSNPDFLYWTVCLLTELRRSGENSVRKQGEVSTFSLLFQSVINFYYAIQTLRVSKDAL